MFFRPTGPAAESLHALKRKPGLKRLKFAVRGKGNCDKLIIGIGQVHPVLTGKFARFQARRIANVQAEIYEACNALYDFAHVTTFGMEGYSGKRKARFPKAFLLQMQMASGRRREVKSVLRGVANRWRKALNRGNENDTGTYASMLNALTVMQALHADVSMYPIEQADVHGAIGVAITQLQQEIAKIETSAAYRSCQKKGGKGLTQAEYEAAKTRNALVKQFNATLKHPERDRAILREVLKHADSPVTVFVLGTGHRSGMLSLTAKHLPDGYLFAWASPPSFWWKKAMLYRVGWVCIALMMLVLWLNT